MNTDYKFESYLEILAEEAGKTENAPFEAVKDAEILYEYEKKHGVKLGIVYKSGYNTFVVDLVRKSDGSLCTYERLIKTVPGNSVVIIPFYNDKFVLLKQYRHALGEIQLSFPRGYGETDISAEENAKKEITEELSCASSDYVFLGKVVADSGICGEKVNVFTCMTEKPSPKDGYEDIFHYITATEETLAEMIRDGRINDAFTLSAYSLYKASKK